MARFLKKQAHKEVKPFGKLGFIGTRRMEQSSIEVFDFTEDEITHSKDVAIAELEQYAATNTVSWINVCGLHDTDLISEIATLFDIHPMVVDKISNTDERPSFEDYDDYLVLSVKQLHLDQDKLTIEAEHVVFILFKHMLLSFQESEKDTFDSIRERLNKTGNRVRKNSSDYLLFALNRAIINDYKIIIEHVGEKIENLETEIFARPSGNILEKLNAFNIETN